MSEPIKVFFIEPTTRFVQQLRRWRRHEEKCLSGPHSVCSATYPLGVIENEKDAKRLQDFPPADARWPTHCSQCGEPFDNNAGSYVDCWKLYTDGKGNEFPLREAPVGACWNAEWFSEHPGYCGADGRTLVVKMPGSREWIIDSRASNCTMPDDDIHKCWIRHGRPEDGTLHVDKNGNTCSAGAGSIALPNWHGFLHNGHLTEC